MVIPQITTDSTLRSWTGKKIILYASSIRSVATNRVRIGLSPFRAIKTGIPSEKQSEEVLAKPSAQSGPDGAQPSIFAKKHRIQHCGGMTSVSSGPEKIIIRIAVSQLNQLTQSQTCANLKALNGCLLSYLF